MKWSLQELNKKHSVEFETAFDLKQELTSREPEILDVSEVVVNGRVEKQGKQKKVVTFKYKPKKGSHRKQGHRQPYTKVIIKEINA